MMLPKNSAYWSIIKDDKKMQKKAKRCRECESMKNGWCLKYNRWCSDCLGCNKRNGVMVKNEETTKKENK